MEQSEQLREHEARELIRMLNAPQPIVIGIEGGPCGGKTTLAERLREQTDRAVVILPEAATDHILALDEQGISLNDLEVNDRPAYLDVEAAILGTICDNIAVAREIYAGTDTVIVADRCDIGAYLSPDEYQTVLSKIDRDMPPMLSEIDKLYYLPSVARTVPDLYQQLKETNPARLETADVAMQVCQRNLAAVARHPELTVGWGGNFNIMIDQMVRSILDPESEVEQKLRPMDGLISIEAALSGRDTIALGSNYIVQSYHELDGQTYRLRQTTTDHDEILYTYTVKTGEGVSRRELQRRLSRGQYETLVFIPIQGEALTKTRSTYLVGSGRKHTWSVDRYTDRRIDEWHVEVDVEDEVEAAQVVQEFSAYFEVAGTSAEKLARSLGARAARERMVLCYQ